MLYFLSQDNLSKLLDALKSEYDVFVPVKKDNQRFYKRYDQPSADLVIGEVRTVEPLKAFFSRAREQVAAGFSPEIPHAADRPLALVGVKACDLKGFKIQDHVFKNHDYPDPFYIQNRQKNLIISADCTCAIETCFCLALGIQPYPEGNFDLNLSNLKDGFVVEVGSQKGQAVVNHHSGLFIDTDGELSAQRDALRAEVAAEVDKNIQENDVPNQDSYQGVIEKKYASNIWEEEAATCVECGACNVICPTCHCFLLYDQQDQKKMARLRIWDSCMIKDFARVAGGANPRPKLWMRLRNRFEKKFDFFPKVADVYACTGCGRCISACPAKIDIRKVLKRLVSDA
ncbi:4Fe-4S dicluster domain-containing protein [Candidatus Omnitrophota bacterium]